eukprot:2476738-Prymnesium_polylepis.1
MQGSGMGGGCVCVPVHTAVGLGGQGQGLGGAEDVPVQPFSWLDQQSYRYITWMPHAQRIVIVTQLSRDDSPHITVSTPDDTCDWIVSARLSILHSDEVGRRDCDGSFSMTLVAGEAVTSLPQGPVNPPDGKVCPLVLQLRIDKIDRNRLLVLQLRIDKIDHNQTLLRNECFLLETLGNVAMPLETTLGNVAMLLETFAPRALASITRLTSRCASPPSKGMASCRYSPSSIKWAGVVKKKLLNSQPPRAGSFSWIITICSLALHALQISSASALAEAP